ncbi:MAG: porphobilinogen synthase [Clostridium sp.]
MINRGRRLRTSKELRSLVSETSISANDFIYPLFVVEGSGIKEEINSLPNVFHYSIDMLDDIVEEIVSLKIKGVILFGVPSIKDNVGSEAYNEDGIVQKAIKRIKEITEDLLIVTDVCMCQYTDHGHCGILCNETVDNDKTLEYLSKIAVSHAKAGADMIAPSDMMDGRIGHIRSSLDESGFYNVSIMSYSAKYCSAFYGPFREAANSVPQFGDRKTYQMDPANRREALREINEDISEGADIIMVKPALSYLDIIREAKDNTRVPVAAYSVSGEYSMIKFAGQNGIIDEERVMMETLISIKRAGADIIITYFALDAGRVLRR